MHLGEYLMHAWLDFLTKLQKFTSFAHSWSASKEYKILDDVVLDKLLAANTNTGSHQIEEYKNSSLVVILHSLNTTTMWHFHYLYVLLRENHKINAVCFPSFHNGCNPTCKVWHMDPEYVTGLINSRILELLLRQFCCSIFAPSQKSYML